MRAQTNLHNLVETARTREANAYAGSGKAWTAHYMDNTGRVLVWHYATLMFAVLKDNTVHPINPGWGSVSDKRGTNDILYGAGINVRYHDLWPKPEPPKREPKPINLDNIKPFVPPISASDTVGIG